MKKGFVFLSIALVAVGSLFAQGSSESKATGNKKVFLITMDQMDQYWQHVNEGCEKAAAEVGGIDYKWLAPDVKDDNKQIEAINNAVAAGADVILLAANGPNAVTAALKEATSANVKIIYVDSPANYPGVQTLATNNTAAGQLAGKQMLNAFKSKGITNGNIGIINVNAATASVVAREKGFKAIFAETDFNILETQYCNGDAAIAKDMASNFITQGVIGLFGANEGCSVGVGNAIKESGNSVIGVGFDLSDMISSLINEGNLLCTTVQNPEVMGYKGMITASTVLNGGTVEEKEIDTGVSIIGKTK